MEIKCPRCFGTKEQVIGFEGKPVTSIFAEDDDIDTCQFCEGQGIVSCEDISIQRGLEDAREGRISKVVL